MNRIVVVGGGDFAGEVISYLISDDQESSSYIGYVSDGGESSKIANAFSLPYLGCVDDLNLNVATHYIICIGNPQSKRIIAENLKSKGLQPYSYVHKSVIISKQAKIGQGLIAFPFSVISAFADIGDFVTLNSYVGIGHDATIGSYSVISSHVDITGNVALGEEVYMGTGSRVVPGIKVDDRCKVSAGTTVFRNMKPDSTQLPIIAKRM